MIDQVKNAGLETEDVDNHEFEIETKGKFKQIYNHINLDSQIIIQLILEI